MTLAGLAFCSPVPLASPGGQGSPAAPAATSVSGNVKSESKLVVLEVVAKDHKGRPVTDLTQNDFRVFDDDQEQSLTFFSHESSSNGGAANSQRYIVLFFDDTNMSPDVEKTTRSLAAKFAEESAAPSRLMAVVNFGGSLEVKQTFTPDPALAKAAVTRGKLAGMRGGLPVVYQGGGLGPLIVKGTEGDYDARSVLQGLRDVAESIGATSGRKSLVLFSSGFILYPERQAELTATIDALNRANIAVFPVDASGVVNSLTSADANSSTPQSGMGLRALPGPNMETPDSSSVHLAINQLILTALAKGTGGFEIFNTNEFLKELDQAKKDMDDYYSLGYVQPAQVHDGSYRNVKIKVERRGIELRYRTGYFDSKSPDLLLGTPEGKAIEARLDSGAPGEVPLSVVTPYFYPEPEVARVDLGLRMPGSAIVFVKKKGEFHSEVHILGIAYRSNGSTAVRFSDTVKLDYDKLKVKEFAENSFTYASSFKIAPGSYTLKLAISSGDKFAKYETPFYVQPFHVDRLSLAGPVLGEKYFPLNKLTANMESSLNEDRPQHVFNNMELVPEVVYRFHKNSHRVAYVEIYDPSLKTDHPSTVGVQFAIVDQKSHKQIFLSSAMPIGGFIRAENPLVPVAFKLPIAQFQAGDYRVEIVARDASGRSSSIRSADFSIE
jgi:VWFA-related protein